jgi:transcription initiation factor TFIIE subunit alpha
MELTQEKIDGLTSNMAGEDAVPIARLLVEKGENVSEFLIAEHLQMGINHVRNALYRLQESNLVTFLRKKDKKKGWYIYYWTFNSVQAKVLITKLYGERVENLQKRLKNENADFLTCRRKCLRISFDNALENDFKCSECGGVLKQIDNKKQIAAIRKELEELTKEGSEELAIKA